ncbi:MAG: thioredoxin domain-containing protein [Zetaproteobacteria bacterium]|nr:thioredoxin domain-containing protein [Zetaproteobacteria bacterium]
MKRSALALTGAGSILGFSLSAYSLLHHLEVRKRGFSEAACNINETLSCDRAALSSYSEWFGIPSAVFGLGTFLTAGILIGLAYRRGPKYHPHLFLLSCLCGCTSIILGYLSFIELQTVCLVCIGIYGSSALLFTGSALLPEKSFLNSKFLFQGVPQGLPFVTPLFAVIGAYILLESHFSPLKQPRPHPATNATDSLPKVVNQPTLAEQPIDIPIHPTAYSGLGEDYRKGPDEAPLTLVEFSDFQCPACRSMHYILQTILPEFEGKVRLVFRNYPLDPSCNPAMSRPLHSHACKTAVLARCAGRINKFWEFHDAVFQQQPEINDKNLHLWAKSVGLSEEQIKTCLAAPHILDKIKDDIQLGQQLGVQGTPSIYINGKKFLGGSADELRMALKQSL